MLTQCQRVLVPSAWRRRVPSHFITAGTDEIIARAARARRPPRPAGRPRHAGAAHRAGAVRVRGAGLSLRLGVGGVPDAAAPWPASRCPRACSRARGSTRRSSRPPPRRRSGHDVNVTFDGRRAGARAPTLAAPAPRRQLRGVHRRAATTPRRRGIIIADTKFEFGTRRRRHPAPDRRGADARFVALLAGRPLAPGGTQPSFDKQPLRDYLAALRQAGQVERRGAAAAAARRGGRGHQRALPRGVPAAHRPRAGGRRMIRIAPEGRPFIVGAWRHRWRLLARAVAHWWWRWLWLPHRGLGGGVLPRSAARRRRAGDELVIAPADGKVVERASRSTSRRSLAARRSGSRSS